ncbi:MAG: hypothetical protein F7C07_08285 [Desulfurococcales archaeon]|nr:hypothetical protein [Desulfurococcales archaeon]
MVRIVEDWIVVDEIGLRIPLAIVYMLAVILISLLALSAVKGLLNRLVSQRLLETAHKERLEKIAELTVLIALLIVLGYIATGSPLLVYIFLAMIVIILASNWEIIANMASYYVMLLTRMVSRGEYIMLPGGPHGWVREITPLYTLVENTHAIYAVPNLRIVRNGKLHVKEPITIRVSVRVWGFEDVEAVTVVEGVVKETIEDWGRDVVAQMGGIRVYTDEISTDSVVIKAQLPVPGPTVNLAKMSHLLKELANALKETGYSFNISLEQPEGFEQRWRVIA